jgi:hypothetical protein
VLIEKSIAIFANSKFISNRCPPLSNTVGDGANSGGCAAAITLQSHTEFRSTEFRNNTGWNGGALWFLSRRASPLLNALPAGRCPLSKVSDCVFDHNGWFDDDESHPNNPTNIHTKGGAIAADAHHVIVQRSNFTRCRAAQGGAIALTGEQKDPHLTPGSPSLSYPQMEVGESAFGSTNQMEVYSSPRTPQDRRSQVDEDLKNVGSLLGDHLFIAGSKMSLTNGTRIYFGGAFAAQISYFAPLTTSNDTVFVCPNGTFVQHTNDMWFCQACLAPQYNLSEGIWQGNAIAPKLSTKEGHCRPCPFGATCNAVSKGDTNRSSYELYHTEVNITHGFYGRRIADGEVQALPCPENFCCPTASCALTDQCALNRDSNVLLCGACKSGFSISIDSDDCVPNKKCKGSSISWYWLIQVFSWACWASVWAMTWHPHARSSSPSAVNDGSMFVVKEQCPQTTKGQTESRGKHKWYETIDISTFEVCVYFYQLAAVVMPLQEYVQTISKFFYADLAHVLAFFHRTKAVTNGDGTSTAATSGWCIQQGMSAKTKMFYGFVSPFLLGLITVVIYVLATTVSPLDSDDDDNDENGNSASEPLLNEVKEAPMQLAPSEDVPEMDLSEGSVQVDIPKGRPAANSEGPRDKVQISIQRASRRQWDSVPQSIAEQEERDRSFGTDPAAHRNARGGFGSAPATLTDVSANAMARLQLLRKRLKMTAGLFYSWILFSYVLLSKSTITLLHCVDVDAPDGTDSGESYLLYDGETECLVSWQWPFYLMLILLLLLPITPLFVKIFLYVKLGQLPAFDWDMPEPEQCNLLLLAKKHPFAKAFLDVCGRQFKQEYWYWSLALAFFRLLLVCCSEGSLNNHPTRLTSSILLVFLCIWGLVVQSHFQPFRSARANYMSELCHVMLLAMAVLNTPGSAWVSVGQKPEEHSALHDQLSIMNHFQQLCFFVPGVLLLGNLIAYGTSHLRGKAMRA